MTSEDLDEDEWERFNCEEDLPMIAGPARSAAIIDEDGIGPCDMPEDDVSYGSDNENVTSFDIKPSAHSVGSRSHSGPDPKIRFRNPIRRRFEEIKAQFLGHRYYCKYVKGNCIKQAALFTSLTIMFLPLILMVLITITSLCFLVLLSLLVPVIALCVGFVITIMWNVWISVPLFLMLAAVWIGADIFDQLFKVPKTVHSRSCKDK